jgi:hypothetical protein
MGERIMSKPSRNRGSLLFISTLTVGHLFQTVLQYLGQTLPVIFGNIRHSDHFIISQDFAISRIDDADASATAYFNFSSFCSVSLIFQ